jgi:NAD(P)-dependent dehydrogenase (short-subunit alcohol dehydrogenase family)
MKRLAGRVAYITGAARGVGRAAAELMGREGAAVFAVDFDGDRLTEVVLAMRAAEINALGGVCDVSDLDSVRRISQRR